MEELPRTIVAEAFALSRAQGAELLLRLGDFDLWRGDLSEMRDDSPRSEPAVANDTPGKASFLAETLVMIRAIEHLKPACRAALAAFYANYGDSTGPAEDNRLIATCQERLLEAYEAL